MWRMSRKQRERRERLAGWAASNEGSDVALYQKVLHAFQKRLQGTVMLPSDPGYDHARQLTNQAFQKFPLLIVYCEVFQDVWECLAFARRHRLWITTRSGGHSTAGYSVNDSMVIDLSRLNAVTIDYEGRRAIVGPGTNWGHLNATLADYGLHMPTGGCGDVCVAGYMQGGGYGFTSRKFGINCDNVDEMLVMLANGRIVRAAADCNADLFWALRGGTGNNFGVLLRATYRLHDMPRLWGFGLQWTLDQAPDALVALQKGYMRQGAPPELGYMLFISFNGPDQTPVLLMRGIYWGARKDGHALLQPLMNDTGAVLSTVYDRVGSYNELNEWLLENIPPCPDLAREDKQSVLFGKPLKRADWKNICRKLAASPNTWSTICIEPYGGAISAVPRDFNAFVHRDSDCDFFVDVFWMNDDERRRLQAYLGEFMALVEPLSNGESYQNYPRAAQTDYRRRYWGEQFGRLLAIKRKYDPHEVFRYGQSVSPEPGKPWPAAAPGAITCEPYGPPAIGVPELAPPTPPRQTARRRRAKAAP